MASHTDMSANEHDRRANEFASTNPTDSNASSPDDAKTSNGSVQAELSRQLGVQRRSSTPLMPAFMVSAPGKVIVHGEHAVVYGKVGMCFMYPFRSTT